LEIKLGYGSASSRKKMTLSITMRTPGNDFDLARGFLFTEGIISTGNDILQIKYDQKPYEEGGQLNSLLVELSPGHPFDPASVQRHFYTSSSCGVCGKTSIEMLKTISPFLLRKGHPLIDLSVFKSMIEAMKKEQLSFIKTGGIHAAAIFDPVGKLLTVREDVGRHNALDKLIGHYLYEGQVPLNDHILLVSGRAGFELVQKAWMAGVSVFVAVGAPSSLAVDLADECNMTLIGFLKVDRFNIYTHPGRIKGL
jgi:FdhD protein